MKRNSLVKILPRRFVPNSKWASIGGNQYTTDFIKKPEAVYKGSASLVFSYSAGVLTITTATAPNSDIFADYPLYFSTSEVVNTYDDPVNETGDVVEWEPRLLANPVSSNSAKDGISGVVSVSSNNIALVNEDFGLIDYFSAYDNYKNKSFIIYARIDTSFYAQAKGVISQVKIGKTISLTVKNSNKLFDSNATLGNGANFTAWTSDNYPSMDPALDGYPIMYGFGVASKFIQNDDVSFNINQTSGFGFTLLQNSTGLFRAPYLGLVDGNHTIGLGAVETPWDATTWITPSSPTLLANFFDGAINNDATRYTIPASDIKYLMPSMNLSVELSGGGSTTMIIHSVDYNNNTVVAVNDTTANPIVKIFRISFHLWRRSAYGGIDGRGALLKNNTTFLTTDNGYKIGLIDIGSAPSDTDEYYYTFTHLAKDQSDVVKEYIEGAGLTVNSASFTAAQTEVDSEVMLVVDPIKDSISDVIQRVAGSCGGIVFEDTTAQEYNYLIVNDSLSGNDWTINQTDILEPEIIPVVDYQDVASSINMKFSYLEQNSLYIPNINLLSESDFSKNHNAEEKTTEINHFLLDPLNAQSTKEQAYFYPRISYSFTLDAPEYFAMQIGDIVRVEGVADRVVKADNDYIDLLIISLKKSAERIEVLAYEYTKIS